MIRLNFFTWTFYPHEAEALCRKIKRNVVAITSQSILDDFEHWMRYQGNGLQKTTGWMWSRVKKVGDVWEDPVTKNDSILPWSANQPINTFLLQRVELFQYSPFLPTRGALTAGFHCMVLCVTDNPRNYMLKVTVRGLCSRSLYDRHYIFDWQDRYVYIGRFNSTITENGDDWLFTSKTTKGNPTATAKITASSNSLALGTHDVLMEEDLCTKGKEDKVVKITITNCNNTEFTCFDGHCVSIEKRCNRIVDCPDSSDEKDCIILLIDHSTYIKDYPPITVDDDYNTIRVPVNISVDILKILDISEVEGVFEVSFQLHMTWLDDRLTYVNLKAESGLNTMTELEKQDVWKPQVVFANTKTQESVVTDSKVIAQINRRGSHTVGGYHEAILAQYFRGGENTITFSRIYDVSFICEYDMAWYPFDVQSCQLSFTPFGNTGEYIVLVRDKILYKSGKDLSKYFIKQWEFVSFAGEHEGVEGKNKHQEISIQ